MVTPTCGSAAEWQRGRDSHTRVCPSAPGWGGWAGWLPRVRRWVVGLPLGVVVLGACSHKPPPDFAPDPGLVARIESLRIFVPASACPGQTVRASYSAVLGDGTEIPFATRYDEDHPPDLHVIFLRRYSPNAMALENGNWDTFADPLLSAMEGFKLQVSLRVKPSVMTEEILIPDYTCSNHAYGFIGDRGRRGEAGAPGPDVTARIAVLSSPFYERLVVTAVEVEAAPPFYLLASADEVPPADWLILSSQGGRGGQGVNGRDGRDGTDGQAGCPGTAGGAGGAGGNGGPGGPGGRGGRITIVVPDTDPFLAGLVDAGSEDGRGGEGGEAGEGGRGGEGGAAQDDARRCVAGRDGPAGPDGRAGPPGREGAPGARPQILTLPATDVFGNRVPRELAALINYHMGDNR
jgi:hypothetical protein